MLAALAGAGGSDGERRGGRPGGGPDDAGRPPVERAPRPAGPLAQQRQPRSRGGDRPLSLGAFLGLRQHQAATLARLDDAFATARRAASSGLPPAVQAGAAAILAERGLPLARIWDAVAAALPDTASAQSLRLTREGMELTLLAPDGPAVLAALARLPGFGAPELRQSSPVEGGQHLVVALPRAVAGARP